MSIATVSAVARRFLSQQNPGALAVKGAWGVGKTFAWRKLVSENQDLLWPPQYSYVSLFGVSSIADLRLAIIQNRRPTGSIDRTMTATTLNEHWQNQLTAATGRLGRLFQKDAGSAIFKGLNVAFEVIAPLMLKDMFICLDDFERLNENTISHAELMGFVSNLKETENCKIAIIMNDQQLGDAAKKTYATYREKVIDIELQFDPSASEAIEWGFPEEMPHRDIAREAALSLKIKNVRVLKKITECVRLISPVIVPLHPGAIKEAVRSAVAITWSVFDKTEDAPGLAFLRRWNQAIPKAKNESEAPPSSQQVSWAATLQDFGFGYWDDIDASLLTVIEQGYIEESKFEQEVNKRDQLYKAGDLAEQFAAAWSLFYESFDDNGPAVVEAFRNSVRSGASQIPPGNIDATVALIRELGYETEAEEMIRGYIDTRKDDVAFFNRGSREFLDNVTDPALKAAFDVQAAITPNPITLIGAISKIGTTGGWSAEEQAVLTAATAQELYDVLKHDTTVRKQTVIRACMQFRTPPYETIAKRMMEALTSLGAESAINMARVRRFGIRSAIQQHAAPPAEVHAPDVQSQADPAEVRQEDGWPQ